ncbi:AI-2E family transporter [Lyngbya confervoides]|uniref:AI-2E family transporter n=1 Tax=Lyngbya confervoides BDU141951 TaxID=1574623 RepID=A0ABD4T5K8_9CYAN|nr:AI-2E family transporter [Lyngbya confervoides]MCM1983760.1 AI-2E family transporter [Lyngbya confervoides BDU141951]
MRLGSWVGILCLMLSLYILWEIRQVLLVGFAAVVLATCLNRLVQLFQRYSLRRGMAVILTVLLFLLFVTGFVGVIVPPLLAQLQELRTDLPSDLEQVESWVDLLRGYIPAPLWSEIEKMNGLGDQLQSRIGDLVGQFFDVFAASFTVLLNIVLTFAVTVMFLANPKPYRQAFILLFPSFYRRRISRILDQCEKSLVGWVVGILFNMSVITIFSGLGLGLLRVKLVLVNAFLAGLLTFIPNLGPTISVFPPALLALTDAPWKAIAVVALYMGIQQVESNILTPLVMERQVSLLPAFTLLSQAAFSIFFGLLGLFLALPIVVVLQVWIREILIRDILNPWKTGPCKAKQG